MIKHTAFENDRENRANPEIKYAIPLYTVDLETKHTLVVSKTSYQVILAPTHLSGAVEEKLIDIIEDKHPNIPFKNSPPRWHDRLGQGTGTHEEIVRDANKWFFQEGGNLGYEPQRRLVPEGGLPIVGPVFESGSFDEIKSLMQGILAWQQQFIPKETALEEYSIVVESANVPEGEVSICILPDVMPHKIAQLLAKLAHAENHFYGTRWKLRDDELIKKYYEKSWQETGIKMSFEPEQNKERSELLKNAMIAWATNQGIVLPQLETRK